MQVFSYSHPTTPAGPGTAITISDAIEIDPAHRFTAAAAVGDASVVAVKVDDPDAAYDFMGLWTWRVQEDALPAEDNLAWIGYVGVQRITRGAGTQIMFPVDTGRRWDLEVTELSSLAGFRVITGADGDRPEEEIGDRLLWLIGTATAYLPAVDNGLVTYDTTVLDANDYRGQFAKDVLSDMALRVGFNWWIYYAPGTAYADPVSLAFFDPNSSLYSSTSKISNVSGEADGTAIFSPYEDAELSRDPQRIAAGVYLPYGGTGTASAVYEIDYTTSYEFAFRDQVAPTASIKTEAAATDLALRFLADNNEQDERVTCTIRMPRANLNDIKHGQRLQARFPISRVTRTTAGAASSARRSPRPRTGRRRSMTSTSNSHRSIPCRPALSTTSTPGSRNRPSRSSPRTRPRATCS